MRTIWKFPLTLGSNNHIFEIEMPKGSRILSVGVDPEYPTDPRQVRIWAEVSPKIEVKETHRLVVFGTGDVLGNVVFRQFIGTVVINPYAWHVYELA